MSTAIQTQQVSGDTMLAMVAGGDCSQLSPEQKLAYYKARCEAAGLDPRAQPFEFVKLQGKEVLYARKAASDQLAANNGIVTTILSQVTEDGIRIVTVRATAKDGRQTEEIGAVAVKGLTGDALCNALMKAVTKAKRRATLGICGLGMLDETEIETVPSEAQREAQRDAVQRQEGTPRTVTPIGPPPATRLWNRLVKEHGKGRAQELFSAAGKAVFGDTPKASNTWTAEDVAAVEAKLYPPDKPLDDVPGYGGEPEPGAEG